MKKWNVTVDLGSIYLEIEADTKEEAERKAMFKAQEHLRSNGVDEYWIGECDEVEE